MTAVRVMDGSEIMYYTILETQNTREYIDLFQTDPTMEFYAFIADNMNALLEGKVIAPEMEAVLLNMYDDKMSGRKMVLRAGDYIVLQNAFRAQARQS
jgi:hypothetical protein